MLRVATQKTILITGATDGLGKVLAERMAEQGHRLFLLGRNPAKGEMLLEQLLALRKNAELAYFNADYADLGQVARAAEQIACEHHELDVIVNNAGLGGGKLSKASRELSADGYELRFQVNYLAHVCLTERLLPRLRSCGRIVNVASINQSEIDFSNLMLETGYTPVQAYCQSKTAQIIYSFDLATRLKCRNVAVNAIHPATYMSTKLVAEHFGTSMADIAEGADALAHLALSDEVWGRSCEYYEGKTSTRAIAQAYDPRAREELARVSQELIERALAAARW